MQFNAEKKTVHHVPRLEAFRTPQNDKVKLTLDVIKVPACEYHEAIDDYIWVKDVEVLHVKLDIVKSYILKHPNAKRKLVFEDC